MDISDIDLPNYGILKISLDKKDVDNLYTIIKKYYLSENKIYLKSMRLILLN